MGVWGSGSFSNDTALDYVSGLNDFNSVVKTLNKFSKKLNNALDAEDASIALAACDLLSIAIGRPPADAPELPEFEHSKISNEQLSAAKTLIAHIRKTSELSELWAEEDDSEWQSALDDLELRLTPSKPYAAPKTDAKDELPDDFLGYCYLCYEVVTERDGIYFEHTAEHGGTCSIHPHSKCIEEIIKEPALNADGSPTDAAHKVLMQHMGFEV